MHAEGDYSAMWVSLYEDIVRNGMITRTTGYPVLVAGRYVMATTPIPRWDVPRLHRSEHLNLFGAGREKRIYAVPPHTDVVPLTFDDVPFEVEYTPGAVVQAVRQRRRVPRRGAARGGGFACSDTEWCARVRAGDADLVAHRLRAPLHLLPDPTRRAAATAGTHLRPIPRREVLSDSPEWMLRVDSIGKVHGAAASTRSRARGRNTAPPSARPRGADRRRLGRVVRRRTR